MLLWSQIYSWCSNIGKIPVCSEVICIGTRSRIPTVEYLWGWKGISSICCGGWRMCHYKSDSMLSLMRRKRRFFYQHRSYCKDYTKQSFQDIWSVLWMLQIRLKLWLCLYHFLRHSLCPPVVSFAYHYLSLKVW